MSDLFCKDCKWAKPNPVFFFFKSYEFAKCHHPLIGTKPGYNDLVTGPNNKTEFWYCSANRTSPCGPQGKYWEAR